jgi:purine-binding chemotaxis protein CheW
MSNLFVVFHVAGAEYAMAAADVLQMESFDGATVVPGVPDYVAGIVQVRGKVIPVIDLRIRFGLPPIERTLDSRLVVGQVGARPVALLVDRAREVLKLERDQIEAPPRSVVGDSGGYLQGVARIGSRLVMIVDFAKVIGEDVANGQEASSQD